MGTAFITCPESAADAAYRAALLGHDHVATTFTRAISGRLARSVVNRFTAFGEQAGTPPAPGYPMTYDAGKALNAAAKARGEHGYAAQWAGQAAALSRGLPAAQLVAALAQEWRDQGSA
ncbi:2-nitropropane dioxygenase [Bordetella holmesii]|nr:2-nitropropane dioxygenase [Bordetella holmesii H558]AOB36783.1 2-nitropropane dioxygenase [Bordetella holmesii]AUL20750.1 2-nitropropane dioxygenase [Bordetella holmesii]AUL24653.1 2-nitropropane dioxygenase [Bordetella holmesii]AUL27402.1 2-nitropropane dioxygenase [Bordetella holmesii]